MTLGKKNSGIARDGHCLQLLLFVGGLGIVDEVEAVEFRLDAFLHIEQALVIHLTIHGRMASGALFHELREHTSVIGFLPLFRDVVEDALALCLSLPIRDDLALIGVDIGLRDVIRLQLTRVECMQIFHRMARQLGERRHSLGHRTAFTNDEFIGTDIDGFLLAYLVEVASTQHGNRHRAVILFVELGFDECALYRERRRCVEILLAQATNAVVHSAKVFWVFDLEVHELQCY